MKGIQDKTTGRFVKNIPVTKNCLVCSKSFSPRLEVQKFCGRLCMGKYLGNLNNKKVIIDCKHCEKSLAFSPSRLKNVKNIFCNSQCYGEWMAENKISTGENSMTWKGGVTVLSKHIRNSRRYKLWREAVFKRDNFTCVECGNSQTGNLNADHIKPFAILIQEIKNKFGLSNIFDSAMNYESLWDISNGRTLCIPCHKNTDTYLNRKIILKIK